LPLLLGRGNREGELDVMGKKSGFTMVELIIVVAIIAILASIIMPRFTQTRVNSKLEGCKANLKQIAIALEMYANENDGLYQPNDFMAITNTHPLVVNKFLNRPPKCPGSPASSTYSYGIDAYASGQHRTFLIYCYTNQGGHADAGLGTNFPRYDSARGYVYR